MKYRRAMVVSFAVTTALFVVILAASPKNDRPYSTALYDADDGLLGASVAADGQWRFLPGQVPDKMQKAIIAFEDSRFFLHRGVDPVAVFRAAFLNAKYKRVVSGGSTISMQTVRLLENNPPRTLPTKIKEAFSAGALEFRYSKQAILSLYAANAPFGGNVVGLEAASWRYFNRSPDNLTWSEAATLAVLPNQPSAVHPAGDRNALLVKRNALLAKLHQRKFLDDGALFLALAEPLPESPYPLPQLAPHYLERAKKMGIIRQKTAINRRMQLYATDSIERWGSRFAESGIYNAAVIVLDTRSGDTLAYVGNQTGGNREISASVSRGNAVDIITSRRSSGSVLKPFLFAAMLDAGLLLPNQLVVDIPMRIGSYKPENNVPTYRGVIPASEALSRSLNIPAVRALREFGIAAFLDILRKCGFTTLDRSADEYGLPLVLGGGEVTLEETARAYAALMNRAANAVASATKIPRAPFSQGAAWLTLEALLYGTRPGDEAAWQTYASAQKIAWKTGTSYGSRDAWAIGTTPDYTVGVWVGNASGEGRPELRSISTAAPIMFDVFSALKKNGWVPEPDSALERIAVCAASGYLPSPHCEQKTMSFKPRDAVFGFPCPYCRTVSLTPDGRYQATADSLTGTFAGEMPLVRNQFVLPPNIEYWYLRHSLTYRKLPPWLPDARADSASSGLSIVFPEANARVFIPIEIDGKAGSLVMEAIHRNGGETLYWDIDGEYLGETRDYHQLAVRPLAGQHTLTVTDTAGRQASRVFEVLAE